jgi:hypothetical protein
MKHSHTPRVCSLIALGAVATVTAGAACGGSSNQPPNAAPMSTGMAQQPPPPAYATAAPAPPGYPATPPPGYPAQSPAPIYAPAAPSSPGQAPQVAYAPPGATPAPTAPQAPALAPIDPNSLQGILAGIQTALQGTVVAGGGVTGDVTEAGLTLFAARAAPGMQPEQPELKQSLNEGQHAVIMYTLQAGKCYTLVGFSPPGAVKDLDLNLLAPPLYITLAGQDLTHNNAPTIGAAPSPMCPVIAFPLQYKLDVFARSGSGQVAVQLYSKAKS